MMSQHHASDLLVSIPARVVERILALHFQSELSGLMFALPFSFGQIHPLSYDLALRIFSEHRHPPIPGRLRRSIDCGIPMYCSPHGQPATLASLVLLIGKLVVGAAKPAVASRCFCDLANLLS